MTPSGTTVAEPESSQDNHVGTSRIVVVDLDEAQPSRLVKLLRKGRGKLMTRIKRIVADLTEAGTIKSGAQPVVIVVRESQTPLSWLLGDDDD